MSDIQRLCAAGAVALLGAIAPDFAHAQSAELTVRVLEQGSERPIAGARIALENPTLAVRETQSTDSGGLARWPNLRNGGDYRLTVPAAEGRGEVSSPPIELRSNAQRVVTLRVPLASAVLDTVVVEASRVVSSLNQVDAEVSATLGGRELAALPIEGRDLLRALVRLPNVVPSTGFFPEAPAVSINGANGLYVNYLIDGLDNNENFLGGQKFAVPIGFARDVTVLANNFSVRFGRTANGVVNVSTRAGGNELQAEAWTLLRPGRPPDAESAYLQRDLSGNLVGDSFERLQTGGSIGGPLASDRSFFYANVEYTRDRNRTVLDAPSVGAVANLTGENRFLLSSFRLDHRFDDAWSGTLRANVGRITIERPGGALGGGSVQFPSAGSDQDRDSLLLAATLTRVGERFDYRGSVLRSGFDWDYGEARQRAPQVVARGPQGLPVAIVGHPGFVFDDRERTWQMRQELEFDAGPHRWTIGLDALEADFALAGGGNPDGNFTVDLTAAQLATLRARALGTALSAQDVLGLNPAVSSYSVELRPATFGRAQRLLALYVEDAWSVSPRTSLTLGMRWDRDSLTGEGSGRVDDDNLAPRLAVNFRPDESSVLRFGAGIFYDKLTYAVVSDALQRNTTSSAFRAQLAELVARGALPAGTDLDRVTFDGNLAVSPPCATFSLCPSAAAVQGLRASAVVNEARILNPDGYRSPYAVQWAAGWQRQWTGGWTTRVDLVFNRSHSLPRLRDLNAPAPFTPNAAALTPAVVAELRALPTDAARRTRAEALGLVRSSAAADASRPIALRAGGARQITVTETGGEGRYRAATFQLERDRRADQRWSGRLAYTWSRLENDTDDINFRASDANDFSRELGPSANDRRHVVSASVYWFPRPSLSVSVAALLQSGQPVNLVPDASVFGTQDLNGDGASFGENFLGNSDRYPGASRNSARLGWSKTIDLGVRYALDWRRLQMEVSADVFNLFDANNESGFANSATTSNQVQFGGDAEFVQRNGGAPRQFQFGLTARF
jgi:hypothetical protein